ncbi:MAG TPA: hypothetical protein VM260_25565 [Pirellula sp.]|nr:hypothetical protein [Pirellula sp.]
MTANDEFFYLHTRIKGTRQFSLSNGVKTAFMPNEPVLAEDVLYSAELEKGVSKICAWKQDGTKLWDIPGDGRGDLIMAGGVLYAAGPPPSSAEKRSLITAVRLPSQDAAAETLWSIPIDEQIERLIAGNGKLVAVSSEGNIFVLGDADGTAKTEPTELTPDSDNRRVLSSNSKPVASAINPEFGEAGGTAYAKAKELLSHGDPSGYAIWFGARDTSVLDAIVQSSSFEQMIVVDEDPIRIDKLRRRWDAAGWYGARGAAQVSKPLAFRAPPYIANMIFVGDELAEDIVTDSNCFRQIYNSVRPYGGVLQIMASSEKLGKIQRDVIATQLDQAEIKRTPNSIVVKRVGPLPGSSDWTHQYGNIANTIKSDDRLVKLPLGVLWFGGNSNVDVLPRHGHGPPEQVVGGRLIIQGMNSLTARDVYTGRVLWHRKFDNLGTFDVFYDSTYADTPLDPAYNQVHIPGANGRGTNFVVTEDLIYVVEGNLCRVLQTASGEHVRDIALPQKDKKSPQQVVGPQSGELLVLSWGGTYGACLTAVQEAQADGCSVALAHIRYLNPFPSNLGEIISRYKQVLIPELNMGQLRMLIRSRYLVDAIGFNKVKGKPFTVTELQEKICEMAKSGTRNASHSKAS